MSLVENLTKLGIAVGSYVITGTFVESLRGSSDKEERDFVASWDKLVKTWETQAALKQMEAESLKLARHQAIFKQRWDKYLHHNETSCIGNSEG